MVSGYVIRLFLASIEDLKISVDSESECLQSVYYELIYLYCLGQCSASLYLYSSTCSWNNLSPTRMEIKVNT